MSSTFISASAVIAIYNCLLLKTYGHRMMGYSYKTVINCGIYQRLVKRIKRALQYHGHHPVYMTDDAWQAKPLMTDSIPRVV